MMAVQVMQAIVRDARVHEEAHVIQAEVRRLVEEVDASANTRRKTRRAFQDRARGCGQIMTSADKIARRGTRIDRMDFATPMSEISAELFDKAAE